MIGDGRGVPDWLADKLWRILMLNTVSIDGKRFALAEGAKMEASRRTEGWPMTTWATDLREASSREGSTFSTDGIQNSDFSVVYNVDNIAFGTHNGPASSNIVQVTDIEN